MARRTGKHLAASARFKPWMVAAPVLLAAAVATTVVVNAATPNAISVTATGKSVSQVRVIADENAGLQTSTNGGDSGWTNMPTMVTTVSIPSSWKTGLLLMTLTADSSCSGAPHECGLRILVDGQVVGPKAEQFGQQTGFDSTTGTDPFGADVATFEAHAMQRSVVVGRGTHTIQVQAAVLDGTCPTSGCEANFTLHNWQLTVLRARVT